MCRREIREFSCPSFYIEAFKAIPIEKVVGGAAGWSGNGSDITVGWSEISSDITAGYPEKSEKIAVG